MPALVNCTSEAGTTSALFIESLCRNAPLTMYEKIYTERQSAAISEAMTEDKRLPTSKSWCGCSAKPLDGAMRSSLMARRSLKLWNSLDLQSRRHRDHNDASFCSPVISECKGVCDETAM